MGTVSEFGVPTLIGYFQRINDGQPWGFELCQGNFNNSSIAVSNIYPYSIAQNAGLQVGDVVLKIGHVFTANLNLSEVETVLNQIGNQFYLVVYRPSSTNCIVQPAVSIDETKGRPRLPTNRSEIIISTSNTGDSFDSGLSSCNTSNSDTNGCLDNFDTGHNRRNFGQIRNRRGSKNRQFMTSETNDFWQSKMSEAGIMSARLCSSTDSELFETLPSYRVDLRCWKCRAPVRPPYIQALSRFYCRDHFRCQHCSCPLSKCDFVEENGQVYCVKDYARDLAPRCIKCRQPIVGQVVTALSSKWHPTCLKCVVCNQRLVECGGTFMIGLDDQQPYCIHHWNEKHVLPCHHCGRELNPQYDEFIEDNDRRYHSWCFSCNICGSNLAQKSFLYDLFGRQVCVSH